MTARDHDAIVRRSFVRLLTPSYPRFVALLFAAIVLACLIGIAWQLWSAIT